MNDETVNSNEYYENFELRVCNETNTVAIPFKIVMVGLGIRISFENNKQHHIIWQ